MDELGSVIFYKQKDMTRAILNYIGSKDFEKAVACIQNDGRSGFMAGLGMAGVVVMADCAPYVGTPKEEKE